ncbi:MAG: DUF4335 domain-containing protein [Cyanobacteria bacterium P01_C01_bin.89]
MNIRRQYSLPSCILTLDGLDTTGETGASRPCLSVLLQAKCQFPMMGKGFECDRDFFELFARSLSLYGQQVISGVRSPQLSDAPDLLGTDEPDELEDELEDEPSGGGTAVATAAEKPAIDVTAGPMQIYPLGRSQHRLWIQPPPVTEGGETPPPLDLELSTLQLFDVVEVVDQFYADTRTLPDVMLGLASVSRRDLPSRSSMADRVWPAVLGTSTLAAAAGVMFLLPFPETVERPEDRVLTPDEVDQLNQPALTVPGYGDQQPPQANPEPTITPLEAPAGDRPDAEESDTNNSDDSSDGESGSGDSDQSSVPQRTTPVAQRSANSPIEQPTEAAPISGEAKIYDPEVLSQLNVILRQSINAAWSDREAVQEDLEFRVGVAADGKVVGYRPVNQPAKEFRSDRLPLRKILFNPVQPRGNGPKQDEPLALFKVVLTDEGQTQVSPLLGSDGQPVFHPPLPSQSSGSQAGE